MQVVQDKALVLRTRTPHKLRDGNVEHKIVSEQDGIYEVAIRWTLEDAQKLVTIGASEVPSPILRDYQWTGKLTPFAHQKETAAFLSLRRKAFCFNEAGTGKTASVIWAADYLMKQGLVKRVLVICPLSIMKSAWQNDLFKFAMHRSCSVAHGSSATRRKIIAAGCEFVIINFDGVAVVQDEIANGGFDLIVVDEANAYKNTQTTRWKTLNKLVTPDMWVWMLTGTPAAQSPLDAFGLAKIVSPNRVPKYYGQYRDSVMYKLTQYIWKPKVNADKTVHNALQPAIRFEKKQCLDLPEVMYLDREAPLTPQQEKYYKIMKKRMLIEAAGEQVTSVNAATNLNKLLQLSGGAVYSDTGEVVEFDVTNRLSIVLEAVQEASHKVLIFVPFTHTIELLKTFLDKHKVSAEVISGSVSLNKRSAIFDAFQTTPDPRVLVIQPQAASHGLTLTAADTIIWYAPVASVETYLQANERINRPGQKNAMTVIHIHGSDVERRLYTMLQSKILDHNKVVELYRQEIESGS
jgi:SNF2 family DNA or RNA helicase